MKLCEQAEKDIFQPDGILEWDNICQMYTDNGIVYGRFEIIGILTQWLLDRGCEIEKEKITYKCNSLYYTVRDEDLLKCLINIANKIYEEYAVSSQK